MLLFLLPLVAVAQQPLTTGYTQCPCVVMPGTTDCLPYDSRYQAANVEEALVSFPDLSIDIPPPPVDTVTSMHPVEDSLHIPPFAIVGTRQRFPAYCLSEECAVCQAEIRNKVAELGLMTYAPTAETMAYTNSTVCSRYRFGRKDPGIRDYHKKGNKDDSSSEEDKESTKKPWKKKHPRDHDRKKRVKRQTNPLVLGTRYQISCSTKGVTQDENGMLTLCSSCWTWRQLPKDYFPPILNEVICDDTDDTCLSGYAQCAPGYRTVQVLKNDTATGKLITMNIQAGSHCDCRVLPGSPLHSLVVGQGTSGPLPAKQRASVI